MLAVCPRPLASLRLFQCMMQDIMTGGQTSDPIDQASSSLSCAGSHMSDVAYL